MPAKRTDAELLQAAERIARMSGMYIIAKEERIKGQPVTMYLLFRRLRFANHGTQIGKRNSPAGLLKLVQKAKEAI